MQFPFAQVVLRMRLRSAAQDIARRGWTVTPGAYFNGTRMACDRSTCWATSCHPLLPDWDSHATRANELRQWWHNKPHSVLLPTGRVFDAIEVPALVGSAVKGVCGPVIVTPTGRWIFLVQSGSELRPELEDCGDIVTHTAGSWVPAPPTVLPEGPVLWQLSPHQVNWQLPSAGELQLALVSALVTLDASFLDRRRDPARAAWSRSNQMTLVQPYLSGARPY